ncbi:TPA: tail fiber protein, partial [Acinetobacter baumannii]|nr:tail fiber protein [Acinetobacter baumannii]
MTVQQIVPYAKYVTNGADSVYTVNFFIEDKENLFIKLNDVVVSMNDYNYLKDVNGIEFHTPLLANQKLEIFRKTKLERTTNFESFNNTFRPEVLNKDLDKIWLNLQEQSHKVDQYDLDYTYSVSTANQALKEVKDAQARADDAYELADLTNTETRPINRGGTGAASSEAARTNLNVLSKEEVVSLIQSGGTGTIVNVSGGGTGATTASQARTNLDIYSKTESNFLALPLGTPIWHNGTRLTIDDGYASYDGQLLNRADFPTLWAKVQSKFVVITDADWLADPKKRAAYSSGNGTTTFRMPDLNGFLADSIKGLHLRGDGNGTIAGETVLQST